MQALYPLAHSRQNFAVFQAAGGKGTFHEFLPPAGTIGHRIVEHPDVWAPVVDDHLRRQGPLSGQEEGRADF